MKILQILTLITLLPCFAFAADTTAVTDTMQPEVDLAAEQIEEGKATFKRLCKACHAIDQRLVGPALKGVHERRDEDWIIRFVQNSNAMIEAGDATAVELYQEYNQVQMPNQPVTADEVRAVLAYIKDAGNPNPSDNPIQRPVVEKANVKPLKFSDYRFWIIYTVTVGLLIIGVYYKAEMEALKKKLASQDNDAS